MGAASRIEPACSGESGSSVSTQIAWPWPTSTGVRTHVAWIASSGRPRILRVSRSFSSSNSSPCRRGPDPSKIGCVRLDGPQTFDTGVPCTRHRLVGREPRLPQPCGVVERPEDAGKLIAEQFGFATIRPPSIASSFTPATTSGTLSASRNASDLSMHVVPASAVGTGSDSGQSRPRRSRGRARLPRAAPASPPRPAASRLRTPPRARRPG